MLAIDAGRNALIVGPASQLGRRSLKVQEVSFVAGSPPPLPTSVTCKIRYTGDEVAANLHPGDSGTIQVTVDKPLRDVTPGQGAVFYQNEVVLGGGIISDTQTEDTR